MSYVVAGTVTIADAPAPNGASVEIWALSADDSTDTSDLTVVGVGELVAVVQIAGGAGAFTCGVPDNQHDYRALYDDGINRGMSATMAPAGSADPIADFSYSPAMLVVDFTDESISPDGDIVAWSWDFGDGGSSTSQNPQHTYESASTFTVILTVTDSNGNTDEIEQNVSVAAASPPAFKALGTAVDSANTTSGITVAWPAGHAAGDIAIAILSTLGTTNYSLTTPAGFVELPDSPQWNNGNSLNSRCHGYWCRADQTTMNANGGSMPSLVIGDVSGDDFKRAQIITFSGCTPSGVPYDVTAGDNVGSASTAVSVPGDTTTTAQCLIVAICTHRVDNVAATPQFSGWANADLTNVTERADSSTNAGVGYGIGVATGVKVSAGPFGATTATLLNASTQARIMVALKP